MFVVQQVSCATYWFTTAGPDTSTDNIDNMGALEQYRQGLTRGDTEVMGDALAQYFTLVQLPEGDVITKDTLQEFLNTFKTGGSEDKNYFMYFDSIIHRQVR